MKKNSIDSDWQKLLDNIFFSGTNIVSEVLNAGKDIYSTWFKKDTVMNTPLHRNKERRKLNGTEDFIE